jgi:hypothetical protein
MFFFWACAESARGTELIKAPNKKSEESFMAGFENRKEEMLRYPAISITGLKNESETEISVSLS